LDEYICGKLENKTEGYYLMEMYQFWLKGNFTLKSNLSQNYEYMKVAWAKT